MKRGIAMVMSVVLVLAACSSGNDAGSGGSGGGGGGGWGGGGGTNTLDARAAASLLNFFANGVPFVTPGRTTSGFFGSQGKKPTGDCVVVTGDTTDMDGDGVYVNATLTANCDTTVSDEGYTYTVRLIGKITTVDSDDRDPWVGRVTLEGLSANQPFVFYQSYSYGGESYTEDMRMAGSLEASRRQNAFVESVDFSYSFSVSTPESSSAFTFSERGSIAFTPSGSWDPDGEVLDGTLSADYTMSWSTPELSGTVASLRVTTPRDLTLRASCNGGEPVAGTLRVTDGNNVLEITWTGCDQYEATFNGQPIQPSDTTGPAM